MELLLQSVDRAIDLLYHLHGEREIARRVVLARIDRDQLRELIGRDQEFALHVMASLANRLRAVDSFITAHIGRKS